MQKTLLVCIFALMAQIVWADKTQHFKVDMSDGWQLLKSGDDDEHAYYTYGNKAKRSVVIYSIGKRKSADWDEAKQSLFISEARQDLLARGSQLKKQNEIQKGRCHVKSLAYFKPEKQSTNVDYYLFCGRRLATANYAIAGMSDDNIAQVEAIQNSFKLR